MTPGLLYAITGALLFCLGLYGLLLHAHLLRKVLAFNLRGSGCFLVLVGLAQRGGQVDPVPHALVLTGIVVAVSATAFALILLRQLYVESGRCSLPDEDADP
jgi:multicomponent Na+:H+ antiporter subunit C